MIYYLDASALVKRYVAEADSDRVVELMGDARITMATARYSQAEIVSALARRARFGDLSISDRDRAIAALEDDIDRILIVELTPTIVSMACGLLTTHALRAGDAVQLASALYLRRRSGREVTFVCFDDRLNSAADGEGLQLAPSEE